MAKATLSGHLFRPFSGSRRQNAQIPNLGIKFPCAAGAAPSVGRRNPIRLPVVRSSLAEQSPPRQEEPPKAAEGGEEVDVEGLVQFLYEDLPHLFDDQGLDRTRYDDRVRFRDPITRHDTIDGYLFNIGLLKSLFRPDFQLHHVKQIPLLLRTVYVDIECPDEEDNQQRRKKKGEKRNQTTTTQEFLRGSETGPYEITTRWTMIMRFILLPWEPELVFTGASIMGINPQTRKFCSHVDIWDSIKNNDYFSLEGLWDVFRQLRFYKTPDLETPQYQVLKRTRNYEVRKYAPFLVVEAKSDKLSGSAGFNNVTGYIFGKNSSSEKIPMTTPVFTQAIDDKLSNVSIQIVLPLSKELDKLPDPNLEAVTLRKVEGGIAAVMKFSGKTSEEIVLSKEKALRSAIIKDGLKPQEGCLLARYNDPGRTWSFIMRNEVLIWLQEFTLV